MKSPAHRTTLILGAVLCLMAEGCGKKTGEPSVKDTGSVTRLLVGEIAESALQEIRYMRLDYGGSVQGGGEHRNEMLKLDALRYHPLATQWAGIKSLEPIPGMGESYFRYDIISELYPDMESASRREAEFDAGFRAYLEGGGSDAAKGSTPTVHFSHGRVFYVLITDMSASWDENETGRLKFTLMKFLTKKPAG